MESCISYERNAVHFTMEGIQSCKLNEVQWISIIVQVNLYTDECKARNLRFSGNEFDYK